MTSMITSGSTAAYQDRQFQFMVMLDFT